MGQRESGTAAPAVAAGKGQGQGQGVTAAEIVPRRRGRTECLFRASRLPAVAETYMDAHGATRVDAHAPLHWKRVRAPADAADAVDSLMPRT